MFRRKVIHGTNSSVVYLAEATAVANYMYRRGVVMGPNVSPVGKSAATNTMAM